MSATQARPNVADVLCIFFVLNPVTEIARHWITGHAERFVGEQSWRGNFAAEVVRVAVGFFQKEAAVLVFIEEGSCKHQQLARCPQPFNEIYRCSWPGSYRVTKRFAGGEMLEKPLICVNLHLVALLLHERISYAWAVSDKRV